MKLAFTTLGCPDWDLETIVHRADEYGFDGVDFRGLNGEMQIFRCPEFSDTIEKTKDLIAQAGLEISCFSSSVRLMAGNDDQLPLFESEIREYSRLCTVFGTKYIRVFGGEFGDISREQATKTASEALAGFAAIAADAGVTVLLETHDAWLNAKDVAAVIEESGASNVGVVWDVHHPYRMISEDPETTCRLLGRWIRYTHWKDSKRNPGHEREYELTLFGDGDLPLERIRDALTEIGYDGFHTLEWEKKWHPEIEEPEKAFPLFVERMKTLMNRTEAK